MHHVSQLHLGKLVPPYLCPALNRFLFFGSSYDLASFSSVLHDVLPRPSAR